VTTKLTHWLPIAAAAFAALVAAAPRPLKASSEQVSLAVIVARTSKVTNITLADLRSTFKGARSSEEKTRLIALNQPPKAPDRVGFDRVVLGMDPQAVGQFWISRKVERGQSPPRTVATLATLRRVVEKLPGAIAYIRPGQLGSEVRAIRVDGKLPEDPGYPVRYQP
jgi:hypothetical protein